MVIILVIHRQHNWVRLVYFLHRNLVWHFLEAWKLVYREEALRSVSVQGPLGPVYNVNGFSSNNRSPSTSESHQEAIVVACKVWGVSWTTLSNNSTDRFSCLVLEFCYIVFCSWRQHSYIYTYIYAWSYVYHRNFTQIVKSMLPCDFFWPVVLHPFLPLLYLFRSHFLITTSAIFFSIFPSDHL